MKDFLSFLFLIFIHTPQPPSQMEPEYIVVRVFCWVIGAAVALAVRARVCDFATVVCSRRTRWSFVVAIATVLIYVVIVNTIESSAFVIINVVTFALYVYISLYIGFLLTIILLFLPKWLRDLFTHE